MKEIFKKIMEVQKLCLAVTKDSKNPFYKSNYVSLDNLVSTITPHLNTIGLLVYHYSSDKSVHTVVADVESGEAITSSFPMIESNDPQKLGSCISYAKRYNLGQLFNIITDRDDDGNAASIAEPVFVGSEAFTELQKHIAEAKDVQELVATASIIQKKKEQSLLTSQEIKLLQVNYNNRYKQLAK